MTRPRRHLLLNLSLANTCVARHHTPHVCGATRAGLSCFAQPFGYAGMGWSWSLPEIAAQINMTWALADHWDKHLPGRWVCMGFGQLVGGVL